jgi:hypothetical protein
MTYMVDGTQYVVQAAGWARPARHHARRLRDGVCLAGHRAVVSKETAPSFVGVPGDRLNSLTIEEPHAGREIQAIVGWSCPTRAGITKWLA